MSSTEQVLVGAAALITALCSAFVAFMAVVNHRSIRTVADEVRTYNSLTMGEKSDADEGRRIDAIPTEDQTDAEKAHLVARTEQEEHE